MQGTDGPDTLEASSHPAVMVGGKGDDVYIVTDPADVVIEQAEGGVDEVRTSVGYTLPSNVENMSVSSSNLLGGGNALVGNSLNNRITGAPFTKADIFGLDGDDILDAGGRYGAYLDGGMGNDTLINNIGESRGGPGADLFVVSPRRAMTAPDAPLTVLDFTPDEGDRIDGSFLAGGDPAALFASGHLRFDAVNQRLIYTHEPGPFDGPADRGPADHPVARRDVVRPGLDHPPLIQPPPLRSLTAEPTRCSAGTTDPAPVQRARRRWPGSSWRAAVPRHRGCQSCSSASA